MSFFESLLLLLAVAILLLQVTRRLPIPYPTMLAAAGVVLALIPGAPQISLDPETALALFIAPALVDAAFDFPAVAARSLWRPLFALAVVAVVLSAAAVAGAGMALAGLPLYAALALGAIVAPPDAAAATAILSQVSMPGRVVAVLKGESLLNDASALLLFAGATAFHHQGEAGPAFALRLAFAVPGGVLLGIVLALLFRRFIVPRVTGTLGGNLLEFVGTFAAWIIAERLELSAVLCLVAFAMTLARDAGLTTPARSRIHSFAVWDSAVFLLNVLAFLLMGLQARTILADMSPGHLRGAAVFALAVVVILVVVRMAGTLAYGWVARRIRTPAGAEAPPTRRESILIGWCGMRGLVTLATAFALPGDFPQRDLIVLTAFAVVLATLVIQGPTVAPLVRLLGLAGDSGVAAELGPARADLASAALESLEGRDGTAADHWRFSFDAVRAAWTPPGDSAAMREKRAIGLAALRRQRERLEELRTLRSIGAEAFLILQEELDFQEVTLSDEDARRIEQS
ncbi:MAG: cation:proton antiporter [Amaricoccus sp.]